MSNTPGPHAHALMPTNPTTKEIWEEIWKRQETENMKHEQQHMTSKQTKKEHENKTTPPTKGLGL